MIKMDSLVNKRDWNRLKLIDKKIIFMALMAFLLGRATLINNLTPFAFAFLAAYTISDGLSMGILVGAVASSINVHGLGTMSYILAEIGVYVFFALKKDEKDYSQVKAVLISSIIFFVFRILGVLTNDSLFLYDVIMVIFESLVAFTVIYLFSSKIPSISSLIVMALVLAGFKDLAFFGIQVKNVISLLIVLSFAYNQGAFLGGGVGLILGMISYISHPEMPFILAILSVAGLMSGVFKDLGKIGLVLGLFLGNGLVSFYINRMGTSFIGIKEIAIAALLFTLISKTMNQKLSQLLFIDFNMDKAYNRKRDEIALKKINRMADLFYNLSLTFQDTAKERDYHDTGEIYGLVDSIANDLCLRCYKYDSCWKENYYNTYHKFFNLFGIVESKGIDESTYSEAYKFCSRPKELLERVDRSVERLKLDRSWKSRLNQNRILLSEQLKGFGKLMEGIAADVYERPSFDEEIEKNLYSQLKNKRIDIKDVSVAVTGQNNYDIFLDLNKPGQSLDKIKATMADCLGSSLICNNSVRDLQKRQLRFKLIRENRYSVATKVALGLNSDKKVSGDSYTFGETDNTHYIVISDGMGIGRKAKEESKTAVSLLERLMEANIEKDLALRTINSVLRAKSNGEMFATMDIGFVDLYSGKLQMIKTGAPATFIKKKNKVEIINSSSLPVGMLEEVDFNIYEGYIGDGDIIVMMSDGVLEAYGPAGRGEGRVRDMIKKIESINPQTIANTIIKMAKAQGADAKDDMTVLVTKVWKNI
ncbi:MAG: stage II sporulation protein E [Tissierellaceae bacterium]